MTVAQTVTIPQAILATALSLNLVPNDTLTAIAHVGDTSITVNSTFANLCAQIAPGGLMSWWDYLGEGPMVIKSVTGNVVTFDFTGLDKVGRSTTGLMFQHAIGAQVATNLVQGLPDATFRMLQNGYPVISSFMFKSIDRMPEFRGWQPRGPCGVVYQIVADDLIDGPHPTIWAMHQQQRAQNDIETLELQLKANQRLIISGVVDQNGNQGVTERIDQFDGLLTLNREQRPACWELFVDIMVYGVDMYIAPIS